MSDYESSDDEHIESTPNPSPTHEFAGCTPGSSPSRSQATSSEPSTSSVPTTEATSASEGFAEGISSFHQPNPFGRSSKLSRSPTFTSFTGGASAEVENQPPPQATPSSSGTEEPEDGTGASDISNFS